MTSKLLPRIGIIGSGFIARGLCLFLRKGQEYQLSKVLTRRSITQASSDVSVDQELVTNSVDELIDASDIVVECTGDPIYATDVLSHVLNAGIPVVTMDSELQITTGSWLARLGCITEAEGDQPGCLAALEKEARLMGFKPLVLGNIKGFLNPNPTLQEMEYWAQKNGISINQVTAFTDGTKVQIEQAFVANGLNASIAQKGLLGYKSSSLEEGALKLAEIASCLGKISDYILSPLAPAGVFIVATHDEEQEPYLKYYKLGQGPYYILTRPFHLCHLEIIKTVHQTLSGGPATLMNGRLPSISVAAIAKRDLKAGETIKKGIGSFEVRGEAIDIIRYPKHLPIGLLSNAIIRQPVEAGQIIAYDDVEINESLAVSAWETIKNDVLQKRA